MDYLKTKGRIFDIQRYSIHDGRGIRTIVFLKGCRLRCRWCCNPESQEYEIQSMPEGASVKTVGRDVTVAEVMETVKKDRAYYRRSQGGLAVSGGECLCQPEFTRDLLQAAKYAGISTAIESTAFAQWSVIEGLLPFLDQFLMDIKHMDGRKHQQFTGQDNKVMLENALRIAQSTQTELIIRVPVIPTFNDTWAELGQIAKFSAGLPNVRKIHLLPYHSFGKDKYKSLGREYSMGDLPPPREEFMQEMQKRITQETKLTCQVGG